MRLLRSEYAILSKYYFRTTVYVAALDELEMAALRMELVSDEKTFKKGEERPSYIIRRAEMEPQAAHLSATKLSGEAYLRKKLGQLFYLRNLEKANSLVTDSNTEECPTCQGILGTHWSVLHCGHSVCLGCIEALIRRHCPPNIVLERQIRGGSGIHVPCPMCRELSNQEEIFYVNTKQQKNPAKDVKVVGNYSTKIVGVVETLLRIRIEEPTAKALVFSNWPSVLVVLQKALAENGISHVMVLSNGLLQRKLKIFKKNPDIAVLLMPIALGSKGLNLTEASHILLVEPMLNLGDEVQALGRIHRIGQTKETHVHRFMVTATIEQRIVEFTNKTKRADNQIKPAQNGGETSSNFSAMPQQEEHEGITVGQMTELFAEVFDNH
ncbi:E3 ubiquitin-protein ligase SHPRH-like [Tropilaelaps mercedesae]|uniref:E3 ubiquitin-protein ligase SHPRH-like n=1 Tax=Tropilaelaps mercedesae TaxID=418985 RepID=A0A1V9XN73_9ACAR|nr:E3 ubiquitin-protein ligase SHPRH-like [Tropilaelaps mercedesae]